MSSFFLWRDLMLKITKDLSLFPVTITFWFPVISLMAEVFIALETFSSRFGLSPKLALI